jgi:methyl-accepting chemotaxis protein
MALEVVANYTLITLDENGATETLTSAKVSVDGEIAGLLDGFDSLGALLEKDHVLGEAVAKKDDATIRDLANAYMRGRFIDLVTVLDSTATVLLRAHLPDQFGDVRKSRNVEVALKEGKRTIGLEGGKLIKLNMSCSVPVFHEGKIVGCVILGRDLSKGRFVASIKKVFGLECTIFLGDERVSTTIMGKDGKPAVGTKLTNVAIRDAVLQRGETVFAESPILGKMYKTVYWPWRDATGKIGGIFFAGQPTDALVAAQRENLLFFLGVGLLACLVMVVPAIFVVRGIVGPLRKLEKGAEAVIAGDFQQQVASNAKDEVGQLSRTFQQMIGQLEARVGFAQSLEMGIVMPFVVVDVGGKVIFVNRHLLDLWGRSGRPEDYLGRTSGEVLVGSAGAKTPIDHVLETKEPLVNHTASRLNAQGVKVSVRISASTLTNLHGEVIGACMFIVDETEIRTQQERIMALNERITASIKQAHNVSRQQADAFQRLSEQLHTTRQSAIAQEEGSTRVRESVGVMSATLEQLAMKANQTAEDSKTTRQRAEEGSRIVTETVTNIDHVAECAKRTEAAIQELSKRTDGINAIVELIKDVADQTNLLALNAAIEAARAGEAGRGFAVVADEVRKLAEKTMQATEEVNRSVEELQTEVETGKKMTDETMKLSLAATELAKKSGESLSAIVQIADSAAMAVQGISEDASEQARTGASLAGEMQQMVEHSQRTTQNMATSETFVEELSSLSQGLKQMIDGMGADRRHHERYTLDSPCAVVIEGLASQPQQMNVRDISVSGMNVEGRIAAFEEGKMPQVRIVKADPPLGKVLDGRKGRLAWQDGLFNGVEFDQNLNQSELAGVFTHGISDSW